MCTAYCAYEFHKNLPIPLILLTYLLTYLLTHSLTPWCRILFEKLIVTQLVKKYPGTHLIGGWMGPRAILDVAVKRKIPSPRRKSNPRTPIA
jgi:hypothetical protein